MELQLAGILPESVVDGPGLRRVLFVQGCPHHCPGCHNPETWDIGAGTAVDTADILEMAGWPGLVSGVTFSGGEPFGQADALGELAAALKARGFHLMAYTGYTWEQLQELADPSVQRFLAALDLLVDGPFLQELRTGGLAFRGSSNQRIIKVGESLESGNPVLDERYHTMQSVGGG